MLRPAHRHKGDVFEYELAEGTYGYIHYVGIVGPLDLIRYLPGPHKQRCEGAGLIDLVAGPSLYRWHGLIDLMTDAPFVTLIGNFAIPEGEDRQPITMKMSFGDDTNNWWCYDVNGKEISWPQVHTKYPELKIEDIPQTGQVTHPGQVRARIAAGWTPSNDVVIDWEYPFDPLRERFGKLVTKPRTKYLLRIYRHDFVTVFDRCDFFTSL